MAVAPATRTINVWALPWPQFIGLVDVALLVFAAIGGGQRSERRLAGMIETARAEGRRDVGFD